MKKTLFSVTFPDGSIFTLPKDWKDVFIAHFGTKKETYKELSDRIIFITGKYMENKAFPSKFDGLKWLAEEKTPDAAAYDDPDFYGESWEEWVIERREWERKTGNIPNPPTWADVAEGAKRIAMRVGTNTNETGLTWLFSDHLGSATAAVDAASGTTSTLRYAPWGEERAASGMLPTNRRYTGQIEEPDLGGIYFYQARWYDPALGRFLSPDTIIPGVGNMLAWDRFYGISHGYAWCFLQPVRFALPDAARTKRRFGYSGTRGKPSAGCLASSGCRASATARQRLVRASLHDTHGSGALAVLLALKQPIR